MSRFPSASSRRSPAFPARANRAWSARCWSNWSAEHLGHEVARGRRGSRRAGARRRPQSAAGGSRGGMESDQAAGARRSETDRPHAALQPRHLHRPVRPRPQAVRRDQGGAGAPLRCRTLLLQCRQGPLSDLRGRRLRDGRAALPAERLRALLRPVTARATTPRRWRSSIAARTSPRSSA